MIIQPNEEGWSFSGELHEDQFCFVYKEGVRIFYGKSNISTTDTLFVGTEQECEAEMLRLGMSVLYRLVTINSDIVFFGSKIDNEAFEGIEFLGTKQECEDEIVRINTETFDESTYKIIYDDDSTIVYFGTETNAPDVQGNEFVGSKQACETEIIRLNLSYVKREDFEQVISQTPYRLVYDEYYNVVFFGPQTDETWYEGTEFLGTKEECEAKQAELSVSL